MNWKRIVKKCAIIITVAFVVNIVVSSSLYSALNSTLHSDPVYLTIMSCFNASGVTLIALIFLAPFSIAYILIVTAKHTLDQGILRLKEQQELDEALEDDAP